MVINELETSAAYRLAKVLDALFEQHQVVLDFLASDFDQLMSISEECASVKSRIVESTSHNTYHENAGYQEASLIQEAIQIFLSEVAPMRLNRRKKSNMSSGA